ncbi:MAG: acyl-ACP thioesterase domain-containing protein [Acidimicrobiia bacterium]
MAASFELVDPWDGGRVFTGHRRVRLGDVTRHGRLRLDAIAAYAQDIANDDTRASGYPDVMGWVVRRTWLRVTRWPDFGEELDVATFGSGTGARWAERRTVLTGDHGGRVDVASIWVHVDIASLALKRLPPEFFECFAIPDERRSVSARLVHAPMPDDSANDARVTRAPWPLRAADFDVLDHVNNAAYWVPVEDALERLGYDGLAVFCAELEYRTAIEPAWAVDAVERGSLATGDVYELWLAAGATLCATAKAWIS